jgi:cell division protein FtsA
MTAERLVAAPYASAMAASTEEERRHGALVVDMGGGLTSFAAFADGRLLHADSVPVGGNHVTFDLARELVTTVQEAERIKTLYGTLAKAASNEAEVFSYPVAGDADGEMHQASKALVREIAKPRIDGLIDLLMERLATAGLAELASRRVVLTGGASQMLGLDQVWSERFGCIARIGRPQAIGRMPDSVCSPAFATVIGLVGVAREPMIRTADAKGAPVRHRDVGYFDRMQRWISESF